MTGTGNGLAVRPNGPVTQQQGSAVAIRSSQAEFDDKQKAALVAMGVSEKATRAELAVFFHQCRNTQLDPFLKQIYLIHRRAKEGDKWVDKPTTQVGIDGFRVIRDRIADKKGQRVEYEDTIWYDADRNAYDVWVDDEPPAACKVVVLVDGRRFPSVLRFNEYCQFGREDANGIKPRTGRWRDGHAHQIEKCAEADALRKAFPNDMAGLILEDAAPLSDPDAPDRLPSDRQRVTADQARARSAERPPQWADPGYVDAEVVAPEDVPPAAEQPTPPVQAAEPVATPAGPAGGTQERPPQRVSSGQVGMIRKKFRELFPYDGDTEPQEARTARLRRTSRLAGIEYPGISSTTELTSDEASLVRRELATVTTAAELDKLIASITIGSDPRDEDGTADGE